MRKLILASSSPRRKALMEKTGIPFVVEPSSFEENMQQAKPAIDLANELSLGKAQDVAVKHPGEDAVILAADTFVVLDNAFLGKPKSREEAKEMLKKLSGKIHHILTSFTIIDTTTGKTYTDCIDSSIQMKNLSEKEIEDYLDKGTYTDKAGAYAIQEVKDTFVTEIEGDYDSIVGLPVVDVINHLQDFGIYPMA